VADPTAAVLSVGLLLDHLGRADQAKKVNAAVAFDLSTRSPQGPIRTSDVGDRLAALASG
jgi:3-isopropylmalate dehydrogenase